MLFPRSDLQERARAVITQSASVRCVLFEYLLAMANAPLALRCVAAVYGICYRLGESSAMLKDWPILWAQPVRHGLDV